MHQLQKIICVGSAFVGKTSLARRFTLDTFVHSYIPTLGVSWLTKTVDLPIELMNKNLSKNLVNDPVSARLSIWDTGGQEMFTYLRPKYYEGASCAIIVYDVTNMSSFDEIEAWANEVSSKCSDIPVVIAGNKYDLKEARAVNREEIIEYCRLHHYDYIETSALSSYNVELLFHHAARLSIQYSHDLLKFRKEFYK